MSDPLITNENSADYSPNYGAVNTSNSRKIHYSTSSTRPLEDVSLDKGFQAVALAVKPSCGQYFMKVYGIGLILAGSIIFTVTGALAKYLKGIPAGEYAAMRGLWGLTMLVPLAFFQGVSLWDFQKKKMVLFREFCSAFSFTLKIFCIKHMKYGDATALYFTAPIFAGLFARIFLKESYNVVNVCATVMGISGIVLIAKPSFLFNPHDVTPDNGLYSLVCVFAAVVLGAGYVAQRSIGNTVHVIVIAVYMNVMICLMAVLFEVVMWAATTDHTVSPFVSPDCSGERWILVGCGIAAFLGQLAFNKGLAMEKSATGTLIRNMDTVVAFFIQIVIFKEETDWMSILGAVLICSGTIAVTLYKVYEERKREEKRELRENFGSQELN